MQKVAALLTFVGLCPSEAIDRRCRGPDHRCKPGWSGQTSCATGVAQYLVHGADEGPYLVTLAVAMTDCVPASELLAAPTVGVKE